MRSKLAVVPVVAAALVAVAATAAAPPPPGATARCRDGTYSFSQHRSGTCSYHGGVAVWLSPTGTTSGRPTTTAHGAQVPVGRTVLLAARTTSHGCRRGVEPDRRCSPGAYYSRLTLTVICSASFRTGSIRNVPDSEKFAVEREYGMPARSYGRTIEIDHIVSLELGGSNDIANLFPEPHPSYHAKDKLENRLHELVCDGGMTLRAAQQAIATDWTALYRRIFNTVP